MKILFRFWKVEDAYGPCVSMEQISILIKTEYL